MRAFVIVVRVLAVVFALVGTSHLIFGLHSDMALGAHLPPEVFSDPVLDSQNRFYGVVFAGNGALLWLVTRDPERQTTLLRVLSWFVFAGGLARLLSIVLHGAPTFAVFALIVIEVIGFPLLLLWHRRLLPAR